MRRLLPWNVRTPAGYNLYLAPDGALQAS